MTSPAPAPNPSTDSPLEWTIDLRDQAATARLARAAASCARPGLCILLSGPVGAGKSFFARTLIQSLMARHGAVEDVPSPTFTLVQSYELGPLDVWHADLYRLTSPDELIELGLEQAFDTALCLIEWPDRLGELRPDGAVELTLTPDAVDPEVRHLRVTAPADLINSLQRAMGSSE